MKKFLFHCSNCGLTYSGPDKEPCACSLCGTVNEDCWEEEVTDMKEEQTKQKAEELKRFLALWENAVCEIRAENKACDNNAYIALLCDRLESSMVAYSKGHVEYAFFTI